MIRVGDHQELPVLARGKQGFLLGTRADHVYLRFEDAPEGLEVGDTLRVFVYTDSIDRIATTRPPKAAVGGFACMRVVSTNDHGAFVDWGLPKDLFIPWRWQHKRLQEGESPVVAVCLDPKTGRTMGVTRLSRYFATDVGRLEVGQPVRLLVYDHTDLGAMVVVDGRWSGLIFASGIFRPLPVGEELEGWVADIRDDGKLTLTLVPPGAQAARDARAVVIQALEEGGGFLDLHDKSPAEAIGARLGLSKKAFKKAVGSLYRDRVVTLEDDGIRKTEAP